MIAFALPNLSSIEGTSGRCFINKYSIYHFVVSVLKPLVPSLRAVESSLKKKAFRLSYRLGDFGNLLFLDLHLFYYCRVYPCIAICGSSNSCLCFFTTAITSRLDLPTVFDTSRMVLRWSKYASMIFLFVSWSIGISGFQIIYKFTV